MILKLILKLIIIDWECVNQWKCLIKDKEYNTHLSTNDDFWHIHLKKRYSYLFPPSKHFYNYIISETEKWFLKLIKR